MKASDIGLLNEELRGNTALTELNLESEDEKRERDGERRKRRMTGNEIGDEGAKAMSEMMKVNSTLTTLNLRGEEERKERRERKRKMNE